MNELQTERNKRLKSEWQQRDRDAFKAKFGYSKCIHYRFGGNRQNALERDGFACVKCGMTDEQHKVKWSRPITVDHKDRNEKNNALDNLQTLCLRCHGRKDISPKLVRQQCVHKKDEILSLRANGKTYQQIADATGFSIGAVFKWVKKWESQLTN